MQEAYRNIIIEDAQVALARLITETLAPVGGKGMYTTGLSPTGSAPGTHWISSGFIDADYAALLPLLEWTQNEEGVWEVAVISPGYPEVIMNMCLMSDPPFEVTLLEVQAVLDASDVTTDQPFAAMARMGLQMVQEELVDG
jgi:hypothetical protein